MHNTNGHAANRSAGAWRAQRNGKTFESMFYAACLKAAVAATRIPDGCKTIGRNRLIRVKSPWDWVISHKNSGALIDTKTDSGKTFPHHVIEPHQIFEMVKHRVAGVVAGYVVWTRANDQVFFVDADIMLPLRGERGSIAPDAAGVIMLGSSASFDPRLIWGKRP